MSTTENGQLSTLRDLVEYIRNDDAHKAALKEIESVESQLAALRKAGANALQWIVKFKELDHGMFHVGDFEVCREPTCIEAHELIAALREALGDK